MMTQLSRVTVATYDASQDRSTVPLSNKLHISVKCEVLFFPVFLLVGLGSYHRGALLLLHVVQDNDC